MGVILRQVLDLLSCGKWAAWKHSHQRLAWIARERLQDHQDAEAFKLLWVSQLAPKQIWTRGSPLGIPDHLRWHGDERRQKSANRIHLQVFYRPWPNWPSNFWQNEDSKNSPSATRDLYRRQDARWTNEHRQIMDREWGSSQSRR